jgi:hypothetical protein
MFGIFFAMDELQVAVRNCELEGDDFVDPGELACLIDRLQAKLCRVVVAATRRGDHLLAGQGAVTWVARTCRTSGNAAADRLCVGKQLEELPRVAEAVRSGEIGFQAASVICHLQNRVGEVDARINEETWIDNARALSIKGLRSEAACTWHALDPTGFQAEVENAHERRQLFISECGDMYRIDGWLEVAAGAAVKTAVDALSNRLGEDDDRSPRQRRADALAEMAHHAMDQGTLPRRNGVRPHLAVHTTIEGLKGELGAAASELADGTRISSVTVQRLACDATLHRILKADSMVVDVGRATRTISSSQRRGIRARHRTCGWAGCDRPISWTVPHHIEFWSRGGPTNMRKLLPLCYHHHRLVHEGGWQIVQSVHGCEFIPPDRPVLIKRRWGEHRRAA